MKDLSAYLLIFTGSGVGGCFRYAIGKWFGYAGNFPLGTYLANLLACFLAAFLLQRLELFTELNENQRLLFIVGFCGGLSTFSSFSLELFQMGLRGHYITALAYLSASLATGLLGVAIGWKLGQGQ